MKYLNLTLPTPEENLSCDDALLDLCEARGQETLRTWEAASPFVVLGRTRRAQNDLNLEACRQLNIPVLRRSSGGGTVLQAPGCLNFSLVLQIRKPLTSITSTNRYVLERHSQMLTALTRREIAFEGISDLCIQNFKVSGNAQRRKKNALLFHGTFLLGMDLKLLETVLTLPDDQPSYRRNRPHSNFVTNLVVKSQVLCAALARTWEADTALDPQDLPWEQIRELAETPHRSQEWVFRL